MKQLISLFLLASLSVTVTAQDKNETLIKAFSESYTLEYAGKYDAAIKTLKQVFDDSYELNLRLGWLHYAMGLYKEAVPYYTKATALMPLSIEAQLGAVLPLSALGSWEKVESIYANILKQDSKHTTVNYRMGLLKYNKGKYDEAEKYFQQVIDLYPFDYDSLVMLGWTYYKSSKPAKAKVLFQKALMVRPGDKSATEGLGMVK